MAIPISMICRFSLVYSLFIGSSRATTFKPNCTLPPAGTSYVSGPNTRGTLKILWNCLSIIFLCTWSIQRLNVPAIRPPVKTKVVEKIWRAILDLRMKIKWMAFTILFPEYLVGKAFSERLAVKDTVQYMSDVTAEWGAVHTYLANMGYFVLDTEGDLGNRRDFRIGSEDASVTPPFNVEVNALQATLGKSAQINSLRLKYRYWALTSLQLRIAITMEIIDPPQLSTSDLEKVDKGEVFVKALALIQVSYLIIQLIARKVAHLPSTQLEIATLAFSASSILTYLLSWGRPQGIETVHILAVKQNSANRKEKIRTLAECGPSYLWLDYRVKDTFYEEFGPAPIPNDATHSAAERMFLHKTFGGNSEIATLAFGTFVGGTLFGGLHCLAWNIPFPTYWEALTWRISSIVISVLPSLSTVPVGYWIRINPWLEGKTRTVSPITRFIVGLVLVVVFIIPYVLARLFLMFEIFRSLFFLPPGAFVDTWSGSFPHWG